VFLSEGKGTVLGTAHFPTHTVEEQATTVNIDLFSSNDNSGKSNLIATIKVSLTNEFSHLSDSRHRVAKLTEQGTMIVNRELLWIYRTLHINK
jgi:hypothetical protein